MYYYGVSVRLNDILFLTWMSNTAVLTLLGIALYAVIGSTARGNPAGPCAIFVVSHVDHVVSWADGIMEPAFFHVRDSMARLQIVMTMMMTQTRTDLIRAGHSLEKHTRQMNNHAVLPMVVW